MGNWRLIFSGPIIPLCVMLVISFFVIPLDGGSKPTSGSQRAGSGPSSAPPKPPFDIAGSVVFAVLVGSFLFGVNQVPLLAYCCCRCCRRCGRCCRCCSCAAAPAAAAAAVGAGARAAKPSLPGQGNDIGWRTPLVVALFCVSAGLVPVLLCIEKRAASPVLPLSLLTDPVKRAVLVSMVVAGMWCAAVSTAAMFSDSALRSPLPSHQHLFSAATKETS